MTDVVMLLAGAGLVLVGVGITSTQPYDWLDGARQKAADDFGVKPMISPTQAFPLNHFRYIRVEQPRYWTQSAALRRDVSVLNATDSADPALRRAAVYDVVRNNRRINSRKFGEKHFYTT
jgi:hypothetical protein